MAKDDQLVAARVTRRAADLLEAAAFVRRISMQKLLSPAVEEFAAQLAKDADVAAAVAARNSADRKREAPVKSIDSGRRRP